MSARHFALLSFVCLVWGLNFVVTKFIVSGDPALGFDGAPPLFSVFLRFALTALFLAPLLVRPPKHVLKVAGVGLLMGGAHFTFLYIGLGMATASTVAVAIQLIVPLTTIMSVLFLNERIGLWRTLGIVLALAGVALIAYQPDDFGLTMGLAFVACAAVMGASGTVLIKMIDPVGPFEMQAWTGAVSCLPLLALSLMTEAGQIEAVFAGGWRFALAVLYVVIVVAILSHAAFYFIIRRNDASAVAPLSLMGPVWGMVFGVLIGGDRFTLQLGAGAVLALSGVALIALRGGRAAASAPVDAPAALETERRHEQA